jgi:hypothetical protein
VELPRRGLVRAPWPPDCCDRRQAGLCGHGSAMIVVRPSGLHDRLGKALGGQSWRPRGASG